MRKCISFFYECSDVVSCLVHWECGLTCWYLEFRHAHVCSIWLREGTLRTLYMSLCVWDMCEPSWRNKSCWAVRVLRYALCNLRSKPVVSVQKQLGETTVHSGVFFYHAAFVQNLWFWLCRLRCAYHKSWTVRHESVPPERAKQTKTQPRSVTKHIDILMSVTLKESMWKHIPAMLQEWFVMWCVEHCLCWWMLKMRTTCPNVDAPQCLCIEPKWKPGSPNKFVIYMPEVVHWINELLANSTTCIHSCVGLSVSILGVLLGHRAIPT